LRDFLALALAMLFKPGASAEKGSAWEIVILTVPTIGLIRAIISIIGFHTFLIKECYANVDETQEQIVLMNRNL
jgi:hypothetical protein